MSGDHNSGGQGSRVPRPAWVDQEVQEVRPYLVAGDRTRPRYEMGLDTVLTATAAAAGAGTLPPEDAHALGLCREQARSVAEIAAVINQPVLVTKIILSDLIECGELIIESPAAQADPETGRPSTHLLQALLDGLEAHEFAVA